MASRSVSVAFKIGQALKHEAVGQVQANLDLIEYFSIFFVIKQRTFTAIFTPDHYNNQKQKLVYGSSLKILSFSNNTDKNHKDCGA